MSPADLLYPLAAGLAEGGWVTIAYLLVDALSKVDGPLGLAAFWALATGACLLSGRLDRLGLPRTALVAGLALGGAAIGLLATGGARAGLLAGDLERALGADPGGFLVGVAALRGFLRGGAIQDPDALGRPIWTGTLGIAAAWIFAGALTGPARAGFQAEAAVPTLGFLAGAVAAAGLARSTRAGRDGEFAPLGNRAWLVALGGLVAALVLVAVPAGHGAERIMAALIAWPLSLPLVIVGALVARLFVPARRRALGRAGIYTFGPLLALAILSVVAVLLPQRPPGPAWEPPGGASAVTAEPTSPAFDLLLAGLSVAIVVATLLFLARAWRRNVGTVGGRPVGDERARIRGGTGDAEGAGRSARRFHLPRLGGGRRPTDASAAYLAALRELEPDADLRRRSDETPAGHARRLHATGSGSLELDLLAADYALARWGDRRLSPTEDRRAVGRWARIRQRVHRALMAAPPAG